MKIVIVIIIFGIIVCNIYDHIIKLSKIIKGQQKKIDYLSNYITSDIQDKINEGIIEICEEIAKKVMSIEEKVETIETKVSLIILKNSITN